MVALLDFEFEAIVCPRLLGEFADALGSSYFQERFDARDLEGIVANVAEVATEYDDPTKVEPLLRDPDDDYLVALAQESGAEAIISGDKDLLDLRAWSRRRSTPGAPASFSGCSTEPMPATLTRLPGGTKRETERRRRTRDRDGPEARPHLRFDDFGGTPGATVECEHIFGLVYCDTERC